LLLYPKYHERKLIKISLITFVIGDIMDSLKGGNVTIRKQKHGDAALKIRELKKVYKYQQAQELIPGWSMKPD
jgi:hypothetical protein